MENNEEQEVGSCVRLVAEAVEPNIRCRRTMEDAHRSVREFGGDQSQDFFAVYDGHGGRGVVDYIAENFEPVFLEELGKNSDSVEEALREAFLKTDKLSAEANLDLSGATAVCSYTRKESGKYVLYSANIGDTRAVICENGGAVRLTKVWFTKKKSFSLFHQCIGS